MKEIWKDIIGYYGLYQVSNLGRVKALYRDNKNIYSKEHYLKTNRCKNGYYRVDLTKNHKAKHYLIHRLVAKAFIPNSNNLPQVNHKDGNKCNNCVDNLEWVSNSENIRHAIMTNLITHESLIARGMLGNNKTRKPVIQLLNDVEIARYKDAYEAQKLTGVPQYSICKVCNGKQKTAYGYEWKYSQK